MSSERPDNDVVSSPRRRHSPLAVTSVAAAVLLAGGGGAYWASTAFGDDGGTKSGGEPAGRGSPPPLSLGNGASKGASQSGPPGIAPGEPDPTGGRTVYRAEGKLPEGKDRAAVYRAQGTVSADEVRKLAGALGFTDAPRLEGTAWKVGSPSGGPGPTLQVNREAPGTWTYARAGRGEVPPSGEAAAVSEQAARAAAAPVLKALGQDDAKLDAGQLMGSVRVVNADPVIDGLPTYGWMTGIQVGVGSQLVGGSGQLKHPVKGAEYPLISADDALKQLNSGGSAGGSVGIGGCATVAPLDRASKETPGSPCRKESPAPPQTLAVSGARLGLAVEFLDGRQALVPSWLFEVKPAGGAQHFTVVQRAVDPQYITAPSISPTEEQNHPGTGTGTDGRRIVSYSADGRKLTVHFWGGVCSTYGASASEDGSAARVTVTEKKPEKGRVCIMIAKDLARTVTLDKPLGDRKVVDASSGQTVPRS
ncbi:hypothetical protein [Streptomyces beijiangensis]|uniref:Large membrane protein n=1 Tax=Streptomyces beijiangensis TaxID=163361 RepID=A0A939F7X1_9ACTN|nr:hypothetical protein [Streptomyces beijiangensis]MBO0513697.1 hypothetical protein [Streptomyces beijiangensis]